MQDNEIFAAEVLYYFKMPVKLPSGAEHDETFAMVSFYTSPDPELLYLSYNTLWSCSHSSDEGLAIISVQDITSVIALIPHPLVDDHTLRERLRGRVYMVDKLGMDILIMAGVMEDPGNGEGDDDDDGTGNDNE